MANDEKAEKGAKNKKTTDDEIAGKEKSKNRREEALPHHAETQKPDAPSNQDQPKAEKERRNKNENKQSGDEKPKKKNEEKKSKR